MEAEIYKTQVLLIDKKMKTLQIKRGYSKIYTKARDSKYPLAPKDDEEAERWIYAVTMKGKKKKKNFPTNYTKNHNYP